MSILEKTPGLLDALKGEMTPKFLATRSSDGIPNVVPVVSILPADDQPDTLFFGNFLLRKSIVNLEQNTHVGILVITADLKGWILTGEFIEWQRTGRYVERQMSGSLLRYNAYTGVRNAGIIRVKAVLGSFHISKLQVASDFLTTRIKGLQKQTHTADSRPVPLSVRTEFERMAAVKVMAWIDADGYPRVIPILSLQPTGETCLVGKVNPYGLQMPVGGSRVAANILTFAAVSYQAKGIWEIAGTYGKIRVEEVYAGGPPKPGGRVY
jgi:hypothetical protein